MTAVTRTAIITYNGWASNATGVNLDGVHLIEEDQDSLTCKYDVVFVGASAAALDGYVDTMVAALTVENRPFTIVVGGTTFASYDPDFENLPMTGTACQQIKVSWQLLAAARSDRTRKYRITVNVLKSASQEITGLRERAVTESTDIRGVKTLTYSATYTPDTSAGSPQDAYTMYSTGTSAFATRVGVVQTILGGTWERIGDISLDYDDDGSDGTIQRFLTATATYRQVIDTVKITYAGWSTTDTGWSLWQAHAINEDQDSFSVTFDAVVTAATHADMITYTGNFITALNTENHKLIIDKNGTDAYYTWEARIAQTGANCQGIRCSWQLLGDDRADLTRVYRVTIDVSKDATQTGKTGLRSQRCNLEERPEGTKTMSISLVYTPTGNSTAFDHYSDGTYGFAARAAAFQTIVGGGTWEQVGPIRLVFDEDERGLTATGIYELLIFDQTTGTRNDSNVFGIEYDLTVSRQAASGTEDQKSGSLATAIVTFECFVLSTASQDTVIINDILPYVKSTVAQLLSLGGSLVTGAHQISVNPVTRKASGVVTFIVPESNVLAISQRYSEQEFNGTVLLPVLDGTPWGRDKHQGPGQWFRQVAITARTLNGNMAALDKAFRKALNSQGENWHYTGRQLETETTVETYDGNGVNDSITITTQSRVLLFEYGEIRGRASGGGSVERVNADNTGNPGRLK